MCFKNTTAMNQWPHYLYRQAELVGFVNQANNKRSIQAPE